MLQVSLLNLAKHQQAEIVKASQSAEHLQQVMTTMVEDAQTEYQHAVKNTQEIKQIVEASAKAFVHVLNHIHRAEQVAKQKQSKLG